MTLENIIIALAIVLLLIYGMTLLQFLTFLYYRFQYSDFVQVEKESINRDTLEIMKSSEEFLCSKGFKFIAMMEHKSPIVGNRQKYHSAYYYNEENGVHAIIETQPYRGALEAVKIRYMTFFEDGKMVKTVNGMRHFVPEVPSSIVLHDHYLIERESVYLSHLKDRDERQSGIKKEPFSQEGILSYLRKNEQDYLQSWEEIGVIRHTQEGYRFRVSWTTWKFAQNVVKGQKKYIKKLKDRKNNIETKDSESHAIITQLDEMGKKRGEGNTKLWFGLSVLFFVGLFTLFGVSLVDIGILVVVLLIHELGHYLAMRYYGYSDTSIFFLPFGAVTVGNKEVRNAYEEYVVSLAGPLPGIIIGIAILAWSIIQHASISGENYLTVYVILSLVINYINLLPIYPLDGGRIVQLLVLHRYPKGQYYFYLLSLIALIIAMLWLQDPVLLIFVVIVALGVRQSYRVAQLLTKLFSTYTPTELDPTIIVEQIIKDKSYEKETLSGKANVAKRVLQIVRTSKPSKRLVMFGMLFYLLLFIPPFVIGYAAFYGNQPSEYEKLPKDAQHTLDLFYEKQNFYDGLSESPLKKYTLEESMQTLEKYLYDEDANRTIGKPLVVAEDTNLTDVPKALQKLYKWHNGISQLLPEGYLFSIEEFHTNYCEFIEEMKEYDEGNFTTPYRVFISNFGYDGLAFRLGKKGIYRYYPYDTKEPVKSYYSINHLLKITAEAYKSGAYYYDYDRLAIDEFKLEKLKRDYFSKVDIKRYEAHIAYLKEKAVAFRRSPHMYVKKEILQALGDMHDSRLITSIRYYVTDANKKVRQQAVFTLGRLGDRKVIPFLIEQLDDAPIHCKGCALSGLNYLVNHSDEKLLKNIYPILESKAMWIRRNAYHVIGKIASSTSIPWLKEHFKSETPACKLAIVQAFGRIGNKEALPLLKNYLKEINEMDFSVSYEERSRYKNPHPQTLQYAVKHAIDTIEKKSIL